ncbi:hypothetical protein CSB95_3127 [Pseudomonas aeruginosa]|nr:hypothetical protein CSC31_1721 [Pseudomonas aeruginosa]AWE83150.1 hypothetical protein CSC29_2656 [Pseudomonas aeruginosa]PRW09025.1 hypothetical protein CSB95_3127 [Pseudomonas aeruginosa]
MQKKHKTQTRKHRLLHENPFHNILFFNQNHPTTGHQHNISGSSPEIPIPI